MLYPERQKPTYCFGVFELDSETGQLRKHGVRLKLQQQPLQVLGILLERAGEVVARDEIQKRLWSGDTYVDFDNSINSAIRKLREALGEHAGAPMYIETLSRKGYRFVAPVSMQQTATEPTGNPECPESKPPLANLQQTSKLGKWLPIVPAAAALLITAAGLGFWFLGSADPSVDNPLLPSPLTSYPGFQTTPSISPEGARVVFAWQQPGKNHTELFLKLIGGGEPVRFGNAGGFAPAWSPDGRQIAFLRSSDPLHASVMVMSALGGLEREITRINIVGAGSVHFGGWSNPPPFLVWSNDSKWLLTVEQNSPGYSPPEAIVRVSIDTGEKRAITRPPPGSFGDGALVLTADNKRLAFTRDTGMLARRDIYAVHLSSEMLPTEAPKRITFDNRRIDGLAWAKDGLHLVFSSSRRGRQELWKVAAIPGSTPVRLNVAADEPSELAVSADGKRLVYAQQFEDTDIWRMSLKAGAVFGSTNLISSTRREGQPQYSPDGQRIAFESNRSGNEEIWVSDGDGSNPVQITHLDTAWAGAPRWSPDGKSLAFASNAAGSWDVYVVNSAGGSPRHVTSGNADETWPSWSHDGEWIYYFSNRAGTGQIWKRRENGGPEVQVTKRDGYVAVESPDGAYLYCSTELHFWAIPTRGGPDIEISRSLNAFVLAFTPTKNGVYFAQGAWDGSGSALNFFDIRERTTKELGQFPGVLGWGMSISPDGRQLLYGKVARRGSELMLVDNFQ